MSTAEKADGILKIGQRVEFFVNENEEKFLSRIEDIKDDELVVAMPLDHKRRPIIPMMGEQVYGLAVGDQCRFRFFSKYRGKEMREIPVWRISKPTEVERFQNREFVRVRVDLPINIQVVDPDEGLRPVETTRTINMSGSGIAFVYKKRIPEGTQVTLEIFNLPDMGTLRVMGKVMRCSEIELPKSGKVFQIGTKMMDLPRPIRNRLIKFIFEIQRKELSKGIEMGG